MKSTNPKELLKFRADPVLRRAIKLRAALDDVDLQDVIVAALRKVLAEEIAEVQRRGLVSDAILAGEPKKRSRKKDGESKRG